jgi:hypothetical protein
MSTELLRGNAMIMYVTILLNYLLYVPLKSPPPSMKWWLWWWRDVLRIVQVNSTVERYCVGRFYLLDYNTIQSGESHSTFRRNTSPQSSLSKCKPSKETARSRQQAEQAGFLAYSAILRMKATRYSGRSIEFHMAVGRYVPPDIYTDIRISIPLQPLSCCHNDKWNTEPYTCDKLTDINCSVFRDDSLQMLLLRWKGAHGSNTDRNNCCSSMEMKLIRVM